MLGTKFVRHRLAATFALVAWLVGLAAPGVVSHEAIDVECGDVLWPSDHHRTAFEDVRPPAESAHCELCHHQRLLRGVAIEARIVAASDPVGDRHRGIPVERPQTAARTSLPPRAPPPTA